MFFIDKDYVSGFMGTIFTPIYGIAILILLFIHKKIKINNKEFTGEKITSLNDSNTKKLYAKWLIDQDQIDKDSANLVDVYIYNLTTNKAVVNNVTVGYVKTMYDNLSKKGKSLVENYSTLKKLMDQYI